MDQTTTPPPAPPPPTPDKTNRTTTIRRVLLLGLSGLLALLILAPIVASLLLRLDSVQQQLISTIESSLGQADSRVKIQGLTGMLPLDMRLNNLQWLDRNGVWLEVEQGVVTLSLGKLLQGEITIQALTAQRIALLRPPISEPEAAPATPVTATPPTPIKLPPFLPTITVDELRVTRLELGQEWLQQAAWFQLSGHMGTKPGGTGSMELTLTRMDQTGTALHIQADLDTNTQQITLASKLEDQSGLLAPLLGGREHDPLQLTLNGQGPTQAWQGQLDLAWPALGTTRIDMTLDLAHPLTAALQGLWQPPAGMLPKEIQDATGNGPIPIMAKLHFDPDSQQLQLNALQIDQEPFSLTGTATTDLTAQTLQGTFHTRIKQLAPLSGLIGPSLSGEMTLETTLSGSLTAPQLAVNMASEALTIDANQLRGVEMKLQIAPPIDSSKPLPAGVTIMAQGSAQSIILADPPEGIPPLHPQWSLTARLIDPETLQVEQLTLDNGTTLSMTGQGTLQLAQGAGRFTLKTQLPQLAELSRMLPWPLQGEATIQLEALLAESLQSIDFQARMQTSHLSGLPAEAILLGPTPTLLLEGVLKPEQTIKLAKIKLTGQDLTLQGQAEMNLQQQTLLADATLQIPDLAPLSPMAGKKLAGQAQLTTRVTGSLTDPKANLNLVLQPLSVDQMSFQTVTLTGEGSNLLQKPTGTLALVMLQPQGEVSLRSRYQVTDGHRIALDDLVLQGPKTQLAGNLQADLKQSRVNGRLKGKIEELAALQAWHGNALSGRMELDITLETGTDGVPKGHILAKAANLAGDFGHLETAQIKAQTSLRANKPVLDAQLEITRLQQNEWQLESLKAHAAGSMEQIEFTTQGKGKAKWPFTLDLKGQATQKNDRLQIDVTHLKSMLGKEPIKLIKPLSLVAENRTLQIKPMELTLGEVTLQGEMSQKGQQVDATFSSHGDLAVLHRLGLYPIRGATRLNINLQGLVTQPDMTITLALKQGRPLAASLKHLPPVDLTLTGTMQKGHDLQVNFISHGFSQGDMKGHATLPLRLSLSPFVANLASDKAMAADMQAEIKLADIGKWLAWEEQQRLEGLLVLDLTAKGTLAHPLLHGTITVENGLFEHADAGTSLHQVQMLVKAMGDVVILDYLTASDGEKGIVQLMGQMQLDADHHYPLSLNLQLAQAFLLRRDDAQANLSGGLRIAGNLQTVRVTGDITVNRAEFYLPNGNETDITAIELDDSLQRETQDEKTAPPASALRTELDVGIKIPARSFIRGRGLDSEWQGAVQVTGLLQEPQIAGQLRIKRGQLDLLDRRFQLTTGLLDFNGIWPPAPTIELEATVQRAEILTRIGVAGVVTKPKIALSSEPIMSEDEILSQLLFDRTTDSITPAQALKLAVTLKNLQSGGPTLMGSVQRELGIDRLEVGGDSVETGSVSAGKYLTDDIYLEVEKGLKADSGRINVEVEMTPRLFLKTGVDAKSNGDIGLQWKKDY